MESIIQHYILLAVEHGECTENGDIENGNKLHMTIMMLISQIQTKSKDIQKLFFETLEHESDAVKVWTATALICTIESESIRVLKHISKSNKTVHGATAGSTIDCWEKGLLKGIPDWNA